MIPAIATERSDTKNLRIELSIDASEAMNIKCGTAAIVESYVEY